FLDALAAFFLNFDRQQLPLVIPLIDRCINIQPFVALKANQAHIQEGRQNLGYLSLAQASVPFQKNGLAQLDQQQDGYGERALPQMYHNSPKPGDIGSASSRSLPAGSVGVVMMTGISLGLRFRLVLSFGIGLV